MRIRAGIPIAALAAVSVACGGSERGEPVVELGTGEAGFEELTDGDDLFIVEGPQGGFHLVGAVRTWNVEPGDPEDLTHPDNPSVEFRAFAGEVRVDSAVSRYRQGLRPGDDGSRVLFNRRILLDIADDAELDGADLRVEVTVTDVDGRSASDQRLVVGVPHPNNL